MPSERLFFSLHASDPSPSNPLKSSTLHRSMKTEPDLVDKRNSSPAVFDPFNNRLARDIRNTLSEAFVDALVKFDESEYQNAAEKWLEGNLDDVYKNYIHDRMERYAQAFEKIKADGFNDAKIQALVIWNHGLFFEVHDHLERVWQQKSGDEGQALKGLIQAAGVYIHLNFNRRQAAARLAVKSLNHIQKYADCLSFIDNLNLLIDKLRNLDMAPPLLKNPRLRSD
jgi:hypothetical protein